MSLYDNFEDIKVGDRVKCHRGRGRDQISRVSKVTPKTFCVEGFGRFWKHNGKGHGDSGCWYGTYCNFIEDGDIARIQAEGKRIANKNTYNGHRVDDFNDDELARVAAIITECNLRRAAETKAYMSVT